MSDTPWHARKLYRHIESHPGLLPGQIAHVIGWHRSTVMRRLPIMERHGYLAWESRDGRLYPFRVARNQTR